MITFVLISLAAIYNMIECSSKFEEKKKGRELNRDRLRGRVVRYIDQETLQWLKRKSKKMKMLENVLKPRHVCKN